MICDTKYFQRVIYFTVFLQGIAFSLKYILIHLFRSLGRWLPKPRPLQGRALLRMQEKSERFWICLLGIQIVGFLNKRSQCHTNKLATEKHLHVCNWRGLDVILMQTSQWRLKEMKRKSTFLLKPPDKNLTQLLVLGPGFGPLLYFYYIWL